MPQLQINQGPQDALLYDNTRSYFTNVGYVRTSNFQVEYRNVDAQNTAGWGSTVQYVIPKAADLLGPVDLCVTIPEPETYAEAGLDSALDASSPTNAINAGARIFSQWVDELGFAMIEKCTFSVGSNDIETITGEQMQLKNELMTADEQRIGYDHVMKTGRKAFASTTHTVDGELPGTADTGQQMISTNESYHSGKRVNKDYTRLIGVQYHNGTNTVAHRCGEKKLIIPLNLFFTSHVSKYFPLAAVAGCNDVRISIKFRSLKELIQLGGTCPAGAAAKVVKMPGIKAPVCKLLCHYVHVTGPEATTLMNKEHVRLLKLWQHQHHTFSTNDGKLNMDLSFLHPVSTLLITIRRANDMNTNDSLATEASTTDGGAVMAPGTDISGKGFFFYHGDGTNPNYDTAQTDQGTVKVKSIQLTLNGQERHPGLEQGIDVDYLNHRLLPMLHSNSNQWNKQLWAQSASSATGEITSRYIIGTCAANISGGGSQATGSATMAVNSHSGEVPKAGDEVFTDEGGFVGTIGSTTSTTTLLQFDATKTLITVPTTKPLVLYRPHTVNTGLTQDMAELDRARYGLQGSKNILVYPFSLNPEGANPSGAVNFSKVSHAKLGINLDTGKTSASPLYKTANGMPGSSNDGSPLRVDVYGLYYNWLQIKSGRALLSFA